MKRVALWVISIFIVLVASAFFSMGGVQLISKPTLPEPEFPLSPQSDFSYLRAAVLANEAGATDDQLKRFANILDNANVPVDADQLTLIASEALAAFDNAHTTVLTTLAYRLPIRLYWTSDALIVVKARPEYANLLGRRILSLGGKTPEELFDKMPLLVGGGTPGWVRYRSEFFYSSPSALSFLGAEVHNNTVEINTRSVAGEDDTFTLSADSELMPGDPFWDFLNMLPGDKTFKTKEWITLLRPDQALPVYLQESTRLYLLRDLVDQRSVYIRMNGSVDDDNETVAQFTQRVLAQIEKSKPQYYIVDFRYNRGGDYTSVLPLIKDLSSALPEEGRLYLITGPNTFSAGLIAGSQFKRYIPDRLTVVGTEVGDHLRFRAEGFSVQLPSTKIDLYLTTAWDDVKDDCGWFDDCWIWNKFLLRGIGSLEPNIRVSNTWASYRGGIDLVMEAVLQDIDE